MSFNFSQANSQLLATSGYDTKTVATVLNAINKDVFIPGIQRPYVWTLDQIVMLFDSLMRGYPIGTLMIWDLPAASTVDWEIYQFIKHFKAGETHNDRIEPEQHKSYKLVLDGQQRLTSLLIGLMGTYTIKKKNKKRASADAWEEYALYLNLAHSADADDAMDDDDNPLAMHYQFQFHDVDGAPKNSERQLWYPVSKIMALTDPTELAQVMSQLIDNNLFLEESLKPVARNNLGQLWKVVWTQPVLSYFTESSSSYDRVLDIFIRANDGGTKLSRSDLCMSVITLRWEQFNAREEIEALMTGLTRTLQSKKEFTREHILRSALFLSNLDFSMKIKNFSPANIRKIEESWPQIKNSLEYTANWLRDNGIYGEYLTSINIMMVIAYYFHRSGISSGEAISTPENEEKIRSWIITLQYQGVLSTQTTGTFLMFRKCIRDQLRIDPVSFPMTEIIEAFNRGKRPIGFDHDLVKKMCLNKKVGEHLSEKLLSLVYDADLATNQRSIVPLIPSSAFQTEELRRAGVSADLESFDGVLALGLALSKEEITHFNLPFESWVQLLTDAQLELHKLPKDMSLYSMSRLPELIQARVKLIEQHLMDKIPNPLALNQPLIAA